MAYKLSMTKRVKGDYDVHIKLEIDAPICDSVIIFRVRCVDTGKWIIENKRTGYVFGECSTRKACIELAIEKCNEVETNEKVEEMKTEIEIVEDTIRFITKLEKPITVLCAFDDNKLEEIADNIDEYQFNRLIENVLSEMNYKVHITLLEVNCKMDDWEYDKFYYQIGDLEGTFKKGLGLRVKMYAPENYHTKAYKVDDKLYATCPTVGDIFHSLLLDSNNVLDYTFSEWCDDYGFDDDSIKALRMFEECKTTANGLSVMFTSDTLEALHILSSQL